MVKNILCMVVVTILFAGCVSSKTCTHSIEHASHGKRTPQVLRHVVLFKFKEDTTPQQLREIEDSFSTLARNVDAIHDLEWGTDVSVENNAKGYTHCLLVTFLSEADRDIYLPHPEHEKAGTIIGPHLEKVLVVDYWAKD